MKVQGPDCKICTFRKYSIFNFCSPHELTDVNDHKSCGIYKKGEEIFQEGGAPLGLYCISSGKVKIIKKASDGKEQIIRLNRPGDIIGYRAIIAGSSYSATAVAMESTVVCFIPKDQFHKLITENDKLRGEVMKRACVALGEAEERMARIALMPVRQRLAEALILLNKVYNPLNEKNFSISISREDLASIIGTAKETATRFLSEFREDNIIDTHGSKIVMIDMDRLAKIGSLYD